MTYYLDREYRVHIEPGADRTPWEDADGIFDGKCKDYIEGFRVVPAGESWVREDGFVFNGEMIAPWKPFQELDAAQRQYELEQIADMKAALALLGVNVDE